MKNLTFLFFLGSIFFASCNNQPIDNVKNSIVNPNDSLVKINEGPFRFAIGLPKDLMIENAPSVAFNSASGELNIKIGESFHLVFTQEQRKMSTVKAELEEGGQLFDNKILEQTGNYIVYQQLLPTGEAYFFHFCANSVVDEKWYFIKTWPIGEYTLENVNRMKQAVFSMRSIE